MPTLTVSAFASCAKDLLIKQEEKMKKADKKRAFFIWIFLMLLALRTYRMILISGR
jgi:hypothetical protein